MIEQIAGSPIFEVIPKEALAHLLEIGKKESFLAGETIFVAGDDPKGIYFVISGSVKILHHNKIIASIGRGEIIGEMSLLMERNHINTAKAVRDTQAVFLSAELFDETIQKFPKAVQLLSKRTIQRYEELVNNKPTKMIPKTLAFIPAGDSAHTEAYSIKLLEAFGPHVRVKRLTSKDQKIDSLSKLEQEYDFLIFQADDHLSEWSKRCMREADRVFLIAASNAKSDLNATEKELFLNHVPKTHKQVELVVLNSKASIWLKNRPVFLHHHVHTDKKEDLLRQVRFIKGEAIGVVLGGGGIRCFSQVGFLQAMQEEKIPIDMVYGCSGGALVGSLFAMGTSSEEIGRSYIEKFEKYKPLTHHTIPLVSLVDDKYIWKMADKIFGDALIEDLPINFSCIAADLFSAEKIVHRFGRLDSCVVSSLSIPGILPPVILNGKFLVDGGVLDNLPFETMKEVFDGKIIVVDASPSEEFIHLNIPNKIPNKS
ncbi:MAG: cyclic nucleotide-binding and patatin-like phospholipase domain-containing protein [Myxococcaceae bacterium]